jgi:hypothetical protein
MYSSEKQHHRFDEDCQPFVHYSNYFDSFCYKDEGVNQQGMY